MKFDFLPPWLVLQVFLLQVICPFAVALSTNFVDRTGGTEARAGAMQFTPAAMAEANPASGGGAVLGKENAQAAQLQLPVTKT